MKRLRKHLSLLLVCTLIFSFIPFLTVYMEDNDCDEFSYEAILELPIAMFNVYGMNMDRGVLAAEAANGVFITWRFFPEEATGYNETGLVGNNFAIYKNGQRAAFVEDSTNWLDEDGCVNDIYVIVTVCPEGVYISRTEEFHPHARNTTDITVGAATAGVLTIPVQRPAAHIGPANSGNGTATRLYHMDQITVGFCEAGEPIFYVKWETGSPDVISQGFTGPVIWDAYRLDGTLLWRLDLGINFRAGQHYGIAMVHNFDGGANPQFMVKTAPGSRVMEVVDGQLTGNYSWIGEQFLGENPEVLTRVTRWDGTRNWQVTDDYRNYDGNTTAASRLRPPAGPFENKMTIMSFMSDFFYHWQSHPEVTGALHGPNLEHNAFADRKCTKEGCEGHGWWMFPPQVMMGIFPPNYPEREANATANAGRRWDAFIANANVLEWTEERWQLLRELPTNPCEFKEVEITREIADALALLWQTISREANAAGARFGGSGHISCGPEFYTVLCGVHGVELDTIEYAVPRGTFRADGSYVPDIGLLWNDFATNQPEPHNRVYRHIGGIAYLEGSNRNASVIEQRGSFSRTTYTRYDWDGERLTSQVIIDSGFEVLPNPFANGINNRGGMVSFSNTHGGPGRKELVFNPAAPRTELIPAHLYGPERLRWMQLNGSMTVQGNHQLAMFNLGIPGFEDRTSVVIGGMAFGYEGYYPTGRGVVHWVGYQARFAGENTMEKDFNRLEKTGHGDAMMLGYFHPSQEFPQMWSCLEGAWWDNVLFNARTGEVMFTDGPTVNRGTPQNPIWSWNHGIWGRDNGRTAIGFYRTFPGQEGWQLHTNQAVRSSPRGINQEGGLRHWDGHTIAAVNLLPGNAFFIHWRPDLTTQPQGNGIQIPTINAAGTGFGTGNPGGLVTVNNRVCGGTKSRPAYVGNIFGDYREQLVLGASNHSSIRIYFNTEISTHKLATRLSDLTYLENLQRQKSCYGQGLLTGFYYGQDMRFDVYFNTITRHTYHEVNFLNYDGSEFAATSIRHARAANAPEDIPVRGVNDACTFIGWSLDGETLYNFENPVFRAITLVPIFEETIIDVVTVATIAKVSGSPTVTIIITEHFSHGTQIQFIAEAIVPNNGTSGQQINVGPYVVTVSVPNDTNSVNIVTVESRPLEELVPDIVNVSASIANIRGNVTVTVTVTLVNEEVLTATATVPNNGTGDAGQVINVADRFNVTVFVPHNTNSVVVVDVEAIGN